MGLLPIDTSPSYAATGRDATVASPSTATVHGGCSDARGEAREKGDSPVLA